VIGMGTVRAVAGAGCLVLSVTISNSAQGALDVVCSASATIVRPGETVSVRAWLAQGDEARAVVRWTTTVGRVVMSGPKAEWTILPDSNSRPPYRATVRVELDGRAGTCTVDIWPPAQGRGPAEREVGRLILPTVEQAPAGYGLYSYLLLGAQPSGDESRRRFISAIEAWWSLAPDLVQLDRYLDKKQLNAFLLPVLTRPSTAVSAAALLDQYDYARAKALLRTTGRSGNYGLYFVSSLKPLSERAEGPYLVQDLSSIPPSLVVAWTKEFLNQSAQERFWEERTLPMLGLRMRTTVRVLAGGLGEIASAWISWGDVARE
jgi:hypothetical protein